MSDFNDDCKDDGRRDCDSRSACTLKDIIRDLDNLNNRDLCLLDAVLDRIIRCRTRRSDC